MTLDPITLDRPLPTKIAIVGFADSRDEAPYADPSWEMWGVNDVYFHVPRIDRSFELHEGDLTGRRNPNYQAWLKEGKTPVYVWNPNTELPSSIAFPKDLILEKFGSYFTNSISWMTALAILALTVPGEDGKPVPREGVELGFWGVDMAHECVTPETRVLTDDLRWVCAGDLRVGDGLLAFDEEPTVREGGTRRTRHWKRSVITHTSEITKPCYQLLFDDGTKITASDNHGWLTSRPQQEWRTTDRLHTSYNQGGATRVMKALEPWSQIDHTTRDAGYLAAAFDCEGHLSQRPLRHCDTAGFRLGFAQRPNEVAARVERLLGEYGFAYSKNVDKSGTQKYQIRGGRPEVLRFLGQVRPERLLPKFSPDDLGIVQARSAPKLVEKTFIGEQVVTALGTSSGTFVGEGILMHNSEYGSQRPSCEYYIGMARALGIKTYIPNTSDLCKTGSLYGIETTHPMRIKMSKRIATLNNQHMQLQQQEAQLMAQVEQIRATRNQLKGAMGAFKYVQGVWTMPTEDVTKTDKVRALAQPSDGMNAQGETDIEAMLKNLDLQEANAGGQ